MFTENVEIKTFTKYVDKTNKDKRRIYIPIKYQALKGNLYIRYLSRFISLGFNLFLFSSQLFSLSR